MGAGGEGGWSQLIPLCRVLGLSTQLEEFTGKLVMGAQGCLVQCTGAKCLLEGNGAKGTSHSHAHQKDGAGKAWCEADRWGWGWR